MQLRWRTVARGPPLAGQAPKGHGSRGSARPGGGLAPGRTGAVADQAAMAAWAATAGRPVRWKQPTVNCRWEEKLLPKIDRWIDR